MKSFVTLASTSHLAEGQHDLPYGQHLEHGGGGGGDDDGRGQHGEHVSVWDEQGQHACGIIIEHSGTDNIKLDPVPYLPHGYVFANARSRRKRCRKAVDARRLRYGLRTRHHHCIRQQNHDTEAEEDEICEESEICTVSGQY